MQTGDGGNFDYACVQRLFRTLPDEIDLIRSASTRGAVMERPIQ